MTILNIVTHFVFQRCFPANIKTSHITHIMNTWGWRFNYEYVFCWMTKANMLTDVKGVNPAVAVNSLSSKAFGALHWFLHINSDGINWVMAGPCKKWTKRFAWVWVDGRESWYAGSRGSLNNWVLSRLLKMESDSAVWTLVLSSFHHSCAKTVAWVGRLIKIISLFVWYVLSGITIQKKNNILCYYFNCLANPYYWLNHFCTSSISPN